ncbi:hypothetical protein CR513_35928, partial [Mucuna pruriens]
DTWWVDSDATTHISVTMQGCLWSRPPSDDERFTFVSDDNKVAVSLYQNSNVVGSGSLIDNLYILDIVSSHNEILQIGSRGTKQKLIKNSVILWHKHLDEILEPLDLSNFEVCVGYIKGKQTNIKKIRCRKNDYYRYDYLYLIHEKSQSLNVFKLNFNLERKLKSSNLIVVVNIIVDIMDHENIV